MRRAILLAASAVALAAFAQEPAPAQVAAQGSPAVIRIGGKVYGGGQEAAINTGNAVMHNVDSLKSDLDSLSVADHTAIASNVSIHHGTIGCVIGGGARGRSFGRTNVIVDGDSVIITENIFGAGEGAGAAVLGGSYVRFDNGTVRGAIYGGADAARTIGSTRVEVRGCQAINNVYGGSRAQDVYGNAFVYLNGAEAITDIAIDTVYGGNDINGYIAPASQAKNKYWTWSWAENIVVPAEVSAAIPDTEGKTYYHPEIDNTWNAFIYASKPDGATPHKLQVGTLFMGGNGDYDYTSETLENGEDNPYSGYSTPELQKGYVQIDGGTYGTVYGGGNNATISGSTDICLNNTTDVNVNYSAASCIHPVTNDTVYMQFGDVFGGNNMAEMQIRPNWYLVSGSINNLYSGGNAGAMTYFSTDTDLKRNYGGIAIAVESPGMTVNNVYGGCRLADVNPGHNGNDMANNPLYSESLYGIDWLGGYSTRVLVKGGEVFNVYGGNDIAGIVHYGAQIEILSDIRGSVYGAGNGSYKYTSLDPSSTYYYDVDAIIDHAGLSDVLGAESDAVKRIEALNVFRPDSEKSWIHLSGSDDKKVYIDGAVFCGGNSTTLADPNGSLENAAAHLQIGKNVVAKSVFLGSNGENMVTADMISHFTDDEGIDLRDSDIMRRYMDAVMVKIRPDVSFDSDYPNNSSDPNPDFSKWTWFGSLYLGGNVGSMSSPKQFTYDFERPLMIFDSMVAGCNNANVPMSDKNAFYAGGLITAPVDENGNPLDKKVLLNLANLRLDPRVYDPVNHSIAKKWYFWQDVDHAMVGKPESEPITESDFTQADRTVKKHGNIYGGCYQSGHINGGVEINITGDLLYTDYEYTAENYHPESPFDIMSSRLSAYGGGYGVETEIWGDVNINVSGHGQILKVFGGGEKGVVGKVARDTDGRYIIEDSEGNPINTLVDGKVINYPDIAQGQKYRLADNGAHSTYISLRGTTVGNHFSVPRVYGGGYEGIVTGNTEVRLGNTRVHSAFGGACNADIYGTSSIYIGVDGESVGPRVIANVYGGNDFGGRILGFRTVDVDNTSAKLDYTRINDVDTHKVPEKVFTQTYVEYNLGAIDGNIFGGSCGNYHYASTYGYMFTPPSDATKFADLDRVDGVPFSLPMLDIEGENIYTGDDAIVVNSFVNVVSGSRQESDYIRGGGITSYRFVRDGETPDSTFTMYGVDFSAKVLHLTGGIFGGSEGQLGRIGLADQCGSYVRLAANDTRTSPLAPNVFGGGYCSMIHHSAVDAFGGNFGTIYGGAYGMSYDERNYAANYSTVVAKNIAHGMPPGVEPEDLDMVIGVEFLEVAYRGKHSEVRLHNMRNAEMDVFGAGANAGSEESVVNLYSGVARDVYGASFSQGYTFAANVYVPNGSNSQVRGIYGGAFGDDMRFICDVANAFVSYSSSDARVSEAIYGGNNSNRMTRSSFIEINCPVYTDDAQNLADIFGAGKGENTVNTFTNVNLLDGARVNNVYGGGCDGRIMSSSSLRAFCLAQGDKVPYYDGKTKEWKIYEGKLQYFPNEVYQFAYNHKRLAFKYDQLLINPEKEFNVSVHYNEDVWSRIPEDIKTALGGEPETHNLVWPGFTKYKYSIEVGQYHGWTLDRKAENGLYREIILEPERGEPGEEQYEPETFITYDFPAYRAKGFSTLLPLYEHGQTAYRKNNSKVRIYRGAVVENNVFGAGRGEHSTVSGTTDVRLLGGIVKGNIYGGGEEGDINMLETVRVFDDELMTSRAKVQVVAGSVTNVYGGGLKGGVYGLAFTTIGLPDVGENQYYGISVDPYTTTNDEGIDVYVPRQFVGGDPAIERSLYGGGHMGRVDCMANLMINNGHIGYRYENGEYVENLDLDPAAGDKLLVENGNVFGGGYGEGANTYYSTVWMYGGTIRNSLYGGGEIASIGIGPNNMGALTEDTEEERLAKAAWVAKDIRNEATESMPGHTHVVMMQGNVHGDVFGGGRGYSYNLQGNVISGERLFSDGYVFGNTHVSIRGGVIGTDQTLANGQGNVFGGGNTGFLYTGAVKCDDDPNSPYKDVQYLLENTPNKFNGRYYTHEWTCDYCGAVTRSFRKPHACWSCQHHNAPNAIQDYTDFHNTYEDGRLVLAEDTRVVVTPYLQMYPVTGDEPVKTLEFDRLEQDYLKDENTGNIIPGGKISFKSGDYVPPRYLNTLLNHDADKAKWNLLDDRGIIIRNAVFAGGNVITGSDKVYANATTVFGNATATLNDIFFRDLISLGNEDLGGLYGDGNLTMVDGYRELNITNYGTDYYNMSDEISFEAFENLTDREKQYFEIQYRCTSPYGDYTLDQIISGDTYNKFSDADKENWAPDVCHVFDGRMMNTIQRADFCGVFGSRIVLHGAEDRVVSEVDYKKYTINRVGELSLNKAVFPGYNAPNNIVNETDPEKIKDYNLKMHGNYFGMYNVVNFLGGLTSDVYFSDQRQAEKLYEGENYGNTTYYQWKSSNSSSRYRNNGISRNKVALASGVALELVHEPKDYAGALSQTDITSTTDKDYGYITGIVELDLLNVAQGEGGGYVYAKNEHGDRILPSAEDMSHTNLSIYNDGARTNLLYTYDKDNQQEIQTSGNFIHPTKRIIDNCYPTVNSYGTDDSSPAHYWFIKGDFYVYDQVISAYTGSSTAYSESIELPLTIALGSHGQLNLVNVQPNLYAYYDLDKSPLEPGEQVLAGSKNYKLNDIITYWDYSLLSDQEKACFVPETMVATSGFTYTNAAGEEVTVAEGTVYLPANVPVAKAGTLAYEIFEDGTVDTEGASIAQFVRTSNEVAHGSGYALAVEFNNPLNWDKYYTPRVYSSNGNGDLLYEKLNSKQYENPVIHDKVIQGPTFTPKANCGGIYGQTDYKLNEPVSKGIIDNYEAMTAVGGTVPENIVSALTGQAQFQSCYVSTQEVEYTVVINDKPVTRKLNPGVGISADEYEALSSSDQRAFSLAYICLVTYSKYGSDKDYIYPNNIISQIEYDQLLEEFKNKYKETHASASDEEVVQTFGNFFDNAYICTTAGKYGGSYFAYGTNYSALDSWAYLTGEERANFDYNMDAFDVISLSDLSGHDGSPDGMYPGFKDADNSIIGKMGVYDGDWPDINQTYAIYNVPQSIDYEAKWDGVDDENDSESFVYYLKNGTQVTVDEGVKLSREQYESLPNDKQYYTPISDFTKGSDVWIVHEQFAMGQIMYLAGQVISQSVYNSLNSDQRKNVKSHRMPADGGDIYYFCRQPYTIGENGYVLNNGNSTTVAITDAINATSYPEGSEVPVGAIISKDTYDALVNTQTNFSIVGNSPMETSTLYVTRFADFNNLSSERVISVIYQYSYQESDESGSNIENIVERHIINVHLQFRSGEPEIGKLDPPATVLPNQSVGLKLPYVVPGAYEVIGGGWEIYSSQTDATMHRNGRDFNNSLEPVYWYQDGYYVAYYAKTFLGKTFSNIVRIKVANYHDLNDVLNHPQYMYIDHPGVGHKSKVYLDDRICYEADGTTVKQTADGHDVSELDLLADLFKVSLASNTHLVETDQYVDADGNPLYYVVGEDGKPTGATTTEPTDYPVMNQADVPVFDDHARNLNNIEFFFNSDVELRNPDGFESIGNATDGCFSGVVHGMGHTVSGLPKSLFGSLCGNVYNLGLTGSFSTSGLADASADKFSSFGCVEKDADPDVNHKDDVALAANCWIYTTSDEAKTLRPVFNYSNPAPSGRYHLVNCYYVDSQGYSNPDTEAFAASEQEFRNGTVAYNLNGLYLFKRYARENWKSESATNNRHAYKVLNEGSYETRIGYYNTASTKYPSYQFGGDPDARYLYVERQWIDGDFIYRYGKIPTTEDVRLDGIFYRPIWPDDYIFFGQDLTYNYVSDNNYTGMPQMVKKLEDCTLDPVKSNRVNRAPGFYRSTKPQAVYFNDDAWFVDKSKATDDMPAADIDRNLTAIDFTGSDISTWSLPKDNADYFYGPIIDMGEIKDFNVVGLTQNLLVYTPNDDSRDIVGDKLVTPEPTFEEADNYRSVDIKNVSGIMGHLVFRDTDSELADNPTQFTTLSSHFLVDKQDFCAPYAYKMGDGYRMWYQTRPENFTDGVKGWMGISLPFESELVSTQQKGEITHFYEGETVGHEYWLRQYTEIAAEGGEMVAAMRLPKAPASGDDKVVENTFLFDYYYDSHHDANRDQYQQAYYNEARTYAKYAFAKAQTPYIIGLPSKRFYEFDLSGEFVPQNTNSAVAKLDPQTITFASHPSAIIGSSADAAPVTYKGYSFVPSFLNHTVPAAEDGNTYYVMADDGSKYRLAAEGDAVSAFRPYFMGAASAAMKAPKNIRFNLDGDTQFGDDDMPGPEDELAGDAAGITVEPGKGRVKITSTLDGDTLVRIYNLSGVLIKECPVKGGETVTVRLSTGYYVVHGNKVQVN